MRPSLALQAGQRRYPFPRRVFQPAGNHWISNRHGLRNTLIVNGMLAFVLYTVVWPWCKDHEIRYVPPRQPTLGMSYATQYKDDPYGEKMFAGQVPYVPMKHDH